MVLALALGLGSGFVRRGEIEVGEGERVKERRGGNGGR